MKGHMLTSRRSFIHMSFAATCLPASLGTPALASKRAVELDWSDLVPNGSGGTDMERLRRLGVVRHGQLSTPFDQATGGQVTQEYDGLNVKIPGYLIPLDFDGTAMTAGLLVPYVGACIHVPPPPPNQLIFVTVADPYDSDGLFEPVWVTGIFGTTATETQLAEIGYAMSAVRIEPYVYETREPRTR